MNADGRSMKHFQRFAIWSVLLLFAAFFLLPLYVMVATSFKDMAEGRGGGLLSLPGSLNLAAWHKAWSQACTGTDCGGLQPFFWNSTLMVVPAVLISTALGAVNGYVFAKWKFRHSELLFGMMLFGAFMPLQVVLLPMSQVLGWFGLADLIWGLVIVHVPVGLATTTLFFRNYYVSLPDELIRAAMLDGAGFWRIFWRVVLPLSAPILVVTLIWQFTQIWNDFVFGVVFSAGDAKPITVGLNNMANTSSSVKEYNVDMAAALIAALPTLAIYVLAGKHFVRGLTAGAVKGKEQTPMGALSIRNVRKSFGPVEILKGIDIEIEEGEFLILVGPSGCGKSTLLSMIAGLDVPSAGSIHIGERDVTHELPKDRDIAMVFQSYALYPNMNVAQNISFALEMRKVGKAERAAAVQRVARTLQIEHLLDRKPGQLSGGQRQRVAMGRALARNPQLFLFDEPLSNLDAKLRVEMRAEIKLLHQRSRTTTVYVTHDQVEAMTLGDRIAVMRDGLVQQFGTPDHIYTRPATRFVAEFIGSPAMNMLPVDSAGLGGQGVAVRGTVITLTAAQQHALQPHAAAGLVIGGRPECVHLGEGGVPGTLTLLEPTGPDTYAFVDTGMGRVVSRVAGRVTQRVGDPVQLTWDARDLHVFDVGPGRGSTDRHGVKAAILRCETAHNIDPGLAPMEYPGNLFVIAAPSGAGKSSLVSALLQVDSHLVVAVSHTTRAPRGQEQDGREYHFTNMATFHDMVTRGEFLEWAEVHGHLYGTSRSAIEDRITGGQDVVLEIDWQGALQIKKLFPNAILIFILPPSWDELLQRLHRRGEDRPEVIARRMANARVEVSQARHFDFVIINALFETALFDLKAIVHSQRLKYAALQRSKPAVFAALDLS